MRHFALLLILVFLPALIATAQEGFKDTGINENLESLDAPAK